MATRPAVVEAPAPVPEENLSELQRVVLATCAEVDRLAKERDAAERVTLAAPDPSSQRRAGRRVNELQDRLDDAKVAAREAEVRSQVARARAVEQVIAAERPAIEAAVRAIRALLIEAREKSVVLHERIERLAQTTASEQPRREFGAALCPFLLGGPDALVAHWLRLVEGF